MDVKITGLAGLPLRESQLQEIGRKIRDLTLRQARAPEATARAAEKRARRAQRRIPSERGR